MVDLGDWNERLAPLFADERYQKIRKFLIEEYRNYVVYPNMYDFYNCFRYTSFEILKVVLLGQDPTITKGRRTGFVFPYKTGFPTRPLWKIFLKNCNQILAYKNRKTEI